MLIIHMMEDCNRCNSLKELIQFWKIKDIIILYDHPPYKQYQYPYAFYNGKRISYSRLIDVLYRKIKEVKNERKRNKE